ncbi:polysaccharide biosynthesis tyrosine autokinase [Actinoplanes solisilvae]|uniref:polysaccharide biosynthesis tyrosine autokinase n=1 Tax=Actinoplanes solisilvae TaxID=2486853 RepID=UPI000FD9A53B|nr:polysaccharide biosynthesis tyrosine autokinase [Actinoplanes solisilvae]
MELREYVRACRRRWIWIVLPVLLAVGGAVGLSFTQEPAYKSSMILFVSTGSSDPDAKASRLNSYITLLTGPRVAQTVVDRLGEPLTPARVQESLSAEVQAGTDLLVVTAKDESSARSREMVTSATSALIALAKRLDPPAAASDGPTPTISIAQDPVTVQEPGDLVRDVGFSAVLGLLVGGVLVAVREATRKTITEEDDLRRLGIGTVGVISLNGRWARSGQADSALAEAFRRLRSLLPEVAGLRRGPTRGTALLLTAANPKEGTTAVACGLAIAMAETGARVLLVDANLRSPGVGRYLAMDGGPGLADVLAGRAEVGDVLRDPLDGRLTVLPPGEKRRDPGEVLASPKLAATVRELTARFDIVLIDAPPLHGVADAAVLSKVTDGALLIVRANRTRTADVRRSTDLLEQVGARLVGAVLNALPRRLPTEPAAPAKPGIPASVDSPGLVTTLLGEQDDEPEAATPPNPVSGRARVSETALATVDVAHSVITPGTLATRPKTEAPATANGHVVAHAVVRGQARVTEADPDIPAQRSPGHNDPGEGEEGSGGSTKSKDEEQHD